MLPVPRRVALISVHTSPLAQPGTGDAGGLNVYVWQTAIRLARRGVQVVESLPLFQRQGELGKISDEVPSESVGAPSSSFITRTKPDKFCLGL